MAVLTRCTLRYNALRRGKLNYNENGYRLIKFLMSLTVWEWLNFATNLVPSARRICIDVVGFEGSRGTEGGGASTTELAAVLADVTDDFTSGA